VLLADFDFHNSTIAFWMKVSPKHGLQEALERAHWLDPYLWKGMVSRIGDLEVLTAPQSSSPIVFSSSETTAVLDFSRANYRFVLVDLPDAIYTSCWEVLEHAAQILITVTPEMASLYLARRKISQIIDRGIERTRIRLVLSRSTPTDLQPAEVEKFLSVGVVAQIGNHYRAVTTAFTNGKLISLDSKQGAQYRRLADHIAGTADKKEEKPTAAWKIRQIFSPA
jgi:Flp pilus assembly CpaE family ATPase